MKRKQYSIEYVHGLEAAAKSNKVNRDMTSRIVNQLVTFIDEHKLTAEFEQWVRERDPVLASDVNGRRNAH